MKAGWNFYAVAGGEFSKRTVIRQNADGSQYQKT